MTSRKNKQPRIISDDEDEEVLEVEEDGPLTMWDLLFDMSAVPDVVRRLVLDVAPFFCGRGKARYDAAIFSAPLASSTRDTSYWS